MELQEIMEKPIAELINSINPDFKIEKKFHPCPFCGSSDAFGVIKRNPKVFKCFSCGKSGNILTYASHVWNCNNAEAAKRLLGKDFKEINKAVERPKREPVYYPNHLLNYYGSNPMNHTLGHFLLNCGKFNAVKLWQICAAYYLGGTMDMRTVFWQIDHTGLIHRGKIMGYRSDGHRKKVVKDGKEVGDISTMWIELHRSPDIEPDFCFFGQHLLTNKPIAFVESEKSAIIASYFLPEYTWMATSGIANLSAKNLQFAKNKQIVLFPDYDGFHLWEEKQKMLAQFGYKVEINRMILNQKWLSKTDGKIKDDIADVILNKIKIN